MLGLLEKVDRWNYVPAGFFTHFRADYRAGPAAINEHVEFFRATDMDFVKVQFEQAFPTTEIREPEDWARLTQYGTDFYAGQLDVVGGLVRELGSEALVVVTLYSPFMVANTVGGAARLATDLEEHPTAAMRGIEIMHDSLMHFVWACIDLGVDGFYHSTQGGESRRFRDPTTFTKCVKPFDLSIMGEISARCPFNILHICDYHRDEYGDYDDLSPFTDYPGTVVNCSRRGGDRPRTSVELSEFFGRPFMGGVDRKGPLATGSEDEARQAATEALASAPNRFILAADCTVPSTTPWGNLRAAIEEAHRSLSAS